MIDHIGLRTAQFDVMTAFYEQALAPLGIKKLMTYEGGAGFGRDAPVLWIGDFERAAVQHPSGAVELGQVRRPGVSCRGAQGRGEGQRRARPTRLRAELLRRLRYRPRRQQHRGRLPQRLSRPSRQAEPSLRGIDNFLPNSRGHALLFRNGAGSERAGASFEAPERLGRRGRGYEALGIGDNLLIILIRGGKTDLDFVALDLVFVASGFDFAARRLGIRCIRLGNRSLRPWARRSGTGFGNERLRPVHRGKREPGRGVLRSPARRVVASRRDDEPSAVGEGAEALARDDRAPRRRPGRCSIAAIRRRAPSASGSSSATSGSDAGRVSTSLTVISASTAPPPRR